MKALRPNAAEMTSCTPRNRWFLVWSDQRGGRDGTVALPEPLLPLLKAEKLSDMAACIGGVAAYISFAAC